MRTTPKQRVIHHKNKAYRCEKRNGKVYVEAERTARGQNSTAGVFDLISNLWEDGKYKAPLPQKVRKTVEEIYSS